MEIVGQENKNVQPLRSLWEAGVARCSKEGFYALPLYSVSLCKPLICPTGQCLGNRQHGAQHCSLLPVVELDEVPQAVNHPVLDCQLGEVSNELVHLVCHFKSPLVCALLQQKYHSTTATNSQNYLENKFT